MLGNCIIFFLLCSVVAITSAYEGYLFYLNFFNLTHPFIPSTLTDTFFQEIFVSGEVGTTVIIQNLKHGTKETKKLFSSNQTFTVEYDDELGGNSLGTNNFSIVVSSLGGPISVQANKATRDSGDGYLALPLSYTSTEYFLASYNITAGLPSIFTVASISDGACIDIVKVSRDGTRTKVNHFTLNANEIFYGSMESDITGIHISSSSPIAAFSGAICVKIPEGRESCDHIVEQMIPVEEWGSVHFVSSFHGTIWSDGFIVRVITSSSQNVTFTRTDYSFVTTLPPVTSSSTIEIESYNFQEYVVRGNTNGPTLLVVDCESNCMVVQYGVGTGNPSDTSNGAFQTRRDPFMVEIPSIDHFPFDVHFSTSHVLKFLNNVPGYQIDDAVNFATLILKTSKVGITSFDGAPLPLTEPGTIKLDFQYNGTSYSSILFPISPGFHSVTSFDSDNSFAVIVYGFGSQAGNNPTGYGYLGGYKYGSASNLIRNGPWFDPSPPKDILNSSASEQAGSKTDILTSGDLPFQIGIWNATFCTIFPLDNIIRKKCSEGYRNYFQNKRIAYMEQKIKNLCLNTTVNMTLLPVQYSEYTCGHIYILLKIKGMKESTLRSVSDCTEAVKVAITALPNWMESGTYGIDKVIDPLDDENIWDCPPVHFKAKERFNPQALGWTCPKPL